MKPQQTLIVVSYWKLTLIPISLQGEAIFGGDITVIFEYPTYWPCLLRCYSFHYYAPACSGGGMNAVVSSLLLLCQFPTFLVGRNYFLLVVFHHHYQSKNPMAYHGMWMSLLHFKTILYLNLVGHFRFASLDQTVGKLDCPFKQHVILTLHYFLRFLMAITNYNSVGHFNPMRLSSCYHMLCVVYNLILLIVIIITNRCDSLPSSYFSVYHMIRFTNRAVGTLGPM